MSERIEKANALIKRYSYWSAGFGLIPLPIVDVAVITGTQIKMVRDLALLYDREFKEDAVRASIGALIGATLPVAVGSGTVSALKTVPVIGQIAGTILFPLSHSRRRLRSAASSCSTSRPAAHCSTSIPRR